MCTKPTSASCARAWAWISGIGENAGFELDDNGGIEVYVSAKKPQEVPEENWLPINREDIELNGMFRICEPDSTGMKTWKLPQFEMLSDVR